MLNNGRFTSDNSATIESFLDLFGRTLNQAWNSPKKREVDVYEAYPFDVKDQDLPPLIITWEYTREQHPEMRELKARERHNFISPTNPDKRIITAGQRFMCVVSFELWSYDKALLRQRNEQFMDFMVAFRGFFKSQGVAEIIFLRESNLLQPWREHLMGRQHIYRVDIEHVTRIDMDTINSITSAVSSQGEHIPESTINKEE